MLSTQNCPLKGMNLKPVPLSRKLGIGGDSQPGDLYYLLGQAILSSHSQDQRWQIIQMTSTISV